MSNDRYRPIEFPPQDPPRPAAKRIAVDEAAEAARREQARSALEVAGSLDWIEQANQIRRANSILLSRVISKIENPDPNSANAEDVFTQLQKCSAIAKQWTAENRQGGIDGEDPTPAELMKKVNKK